MSLWTPSGEHRVDPGGRPAPSPPSPGTAGSGPAAGGRADQGGGAPGVGDGGPEDEARQLDELRRQLAEAPADVVVANHCYGLFELAAVYLSQSPPLLEQARLAIDSLGLLVDGLGERLGEASGSLHEALAQLRLTYVQVDAADQARRGAEGQG